VSDIRQYTDPTRQSFIGVVEIVRALRARFRVVAFFGVVFAVVTAAVSLTLTPVYQSTARILIDPSVRQPFEDRAFPGSTMTDTFGVDSQVEVIQSSVILERVVLSQNLIEDPEFGADAKPRGLGAMLRSLLGSSPQTSNQDAMSKTIDALRKALEVKRAGQTFVINVSVQSQSAEKAAILANAIAESYTADQERRISDQGLQVQEQVVDRLSSIRDRLRAAEDKVERFKAENNLQATGENATVSSQELAIIAGRLSEERAALAAAEAKTQEIQRLIDVGASPDILSDATNSTVISSLREQLTIAARNEANLAANLLPSHPSLVEARAQVERVRRLIEEEAQRIAASARLEADVARDLVVKVESELERARRISNETSQSQVELQELQIEADAIRGLYENLLTRTKEVAEAEQITLPVARVISAAQVPDSPVWPKRKLMVVLAGILGGMLGGAIVVGRTAWQMASAHFTPPGLGAPAVYQRVHEPAPLPPARAQDTSRVPAGMLRTQDRRHVLTRRFNRGIRRPDHSSTAGLLRSLRRYETGIHDRNTQYWREIEAILDQVNFARSRGNGAIVKVTSERDDHGVVSFSFAVMASRLDESVLLLDLSDALDRNSAGRAAQNNQDVLSALNIEFLAPKAGRRKYASSVLADEAELDRYRSEFDLVIVNAPAQMAAEAPRPHTHFVVVEEESVNA